MASSDNIDDWEEIPIDDGIDDWEEIPVDSKPKEKISTLESAIRGGAQGFPFIGSYSDEAEAAARSLLSGTPYKEEREKSRARFAAAEKENPLAYNTANIGVGVFGDIPRAVPGLGNLYGAVEGGVYGLGASEADLTEGDISGAVNDTGLGAGIGFAAPKVLRS